MVKELPGRAANGVVALLLLLAGLIAAVATLVRGATTESVPLAVTGAALGHVEEN